MSYPEIYPAGTQDFALPGVPLTDAYDVCTTLRINTASGLTFNILFTSMQRRLVKRGAIVKAGGQLYILKIVYDGADAGRPYLRANGKHLFWELCERKHLPMAFWIGQNAQTILASAFAGITYAGAAVTMLGASEIAALGLTPVTAPTDIEMDKPNPLEVLAKVIDNVNGELYVDNLSFALVKQLGRDTAVMFRMDRNAKGIERTDEETKLVTRLYPYGRSGLEISSVNGGRPYIDSPHIGDYPYIHEGHIDLSDYQNPSALLARAQMEFAPDNPHRIDVPKISFRCGVVDLWKLADPKYANEKIGLGDYAWVYDTELGVEARVRAVQIEQYPYEPHNSVITFGDPPRTVVDVLSDMDTRNAYFRMPEPSPPPSEGEGLTEDEVIELINTSPNTFDAYFYERGIYETNIDALDATKPRPEDGVRQFIRIDGGVITWVHSELAEDPDEYDTDGWAYLLSSREERLYWTEIADSEFGFKDDYTNDNETPFPVTWTHVDHPPYTRVTVFDPMTFRNVKFGTRPNPALPGQQQNMTPQQIEKAREQLKARYVVRIRKTVREVVLGTMGNIGDNAYLTRKFYENENDAIGKEVGFRLTDRAQYRHADDENWSDVGTGEGSAVIIERLI